MLQAPARASVGQIHTKWAWSIKINFFPLPQLQKRGEGNNFYIFYLGDVWITILKVISVKQGSACKKPDNNYLKLCGPGVIAAANQLCCFTVRGAIDTRQTGGLGCVSIKLYLKKQAVGQTWPLGHSLLTSGLRFCLSFIDCVVWSSTWVVSDKTRQNTGQFQIQGGVGNLLYSLETLPGWECGDLVVTAPFLTPWRSCHWARNTLSKLSWCESSIPAWSSSSLILVGGLDSIHMLWNPPVSEVMLVWVLSSTQGEEQGQLCVFLCFSSVRFQMV